MSDRHRQSMLLFFCLVLPTALIVLAMITGTKGEALYDWLNTWQQLIAALIALSAAGLTLGQMRRSDFLQERRHRELMEHSLQRDRLRIERAVDQATRLIVPGSHLMLFDGASLESESHAVPVWMEWFVAELEHPNIHGAEDLFDVEVASTLRVIRYGTNKWEEWGHRMDREDDPERPKILDRARLSISQVGHYQHFITGLRRLSAAHSRRYEPAVL